MAARSASSEKCQELVGEVVVRGSVQLGIPEPLSVLHTHPPVASREEEGPPAPPGTPPASSDRCRERLARALFAARQHLLLTLTLSCSLSSSSALTLWASVSALPQISFPCVPLPAPGTLTFSPLLPLFPLTSLHPHFFLPEKNSSP